MIRQRENDTTQSQSRNRNDAVLPADAARDEESIPAEEATTEDRTPAELIDEEKDQPPSDLYDTSPADQDLTVVDKSEIGGAGGADEAELARVHPLDGKPWDGDPNEPLPPDPSVGKDFPEGDPNNGGKS